MLTIQMSDIAVALRFQKPWAFTSAFEYAGTCTCTGLPDNLSAPFTVHPLPPWD